MSAFLIMGTVVRGAISGGKGEGREYIWQTCTFKLVYDNG
jgi:hypothetical protein